MSEEPPLANHTFTFGNTNLIVNCRKTLDQTINFKLTVQCELDEIWDSLKDFGGGYPDSSDDENPPSDPTTAAAAASDLIQQQRLEKEEEEEEEEKPDLLGLDIWPAAIELCNYLSDNPTLVAGKTVVELGAGVGLPGLLAARLNASRVVLTDYEPQVVAHMAHNACLCNISSSVCTGLCLDWTKLDLLPAEHAAAFQIILAADVLYIADIMPGFVAAMNALLALHSDSVVIIGHQTRRALVLDETKTPTMINDDVAFKKFKKLSLQAGFYLKELGKRESPGFPGPLYMFACAREEKYIENLPLAYLKKKESGVGLAEDSASL
jgi:predicted nicotinamide N-methyase